MSATTSTESVTTVDAGITIRVNDEPRTVAGAAVLSDLVRDLGLTERKGVAVAVNDVVVARAGWPGHALANGDRVLVIRATQGG
jgi:sulfur carrier protein